MAELRPANENPWYVLMTLYGDPNGPNDSFDWSLHRKNVAVWNAWTGQALSSEQKSFIKSAFPEYYQQIRRWKSLRVEAERQYEARKRGICSGETTPHQIPDPRMSIDLTELSFDSGLSFDGMMFARPLGSGPVKLLAFGLVD
jgi:hypothetical protein